jgi:hypothetical protein
MRLVSVISVLFLCGAATAAAQRATLTPVPEAQRYLVPAAQLMRVDEGVFEVPADTTIDLTDRKILLSVTTFLSGRDKKCCNISFNGDRESWRAVGHRFDLKRIRGTKSYVEDKAECFLDVIDVATPKGAPWLATFRLHCP